MSKIDDLYEMVLQNYKELKLKFDNRVLDNCKCFIFKEDKMKMVLILDPGFNITVFSNNKNISLIKYILQQEYFDFSIVPDYLFLGNIMLIGDSSYGLKALRKNADSYFEKPSISELNVLLNGINYLYALFEYDMNAILNQNKNVWFIGDFDSKNLTCNFDIKKFKTTNSLRTYPKRPKYDLKILNHNKSGCGIFIIPIELPIYSSSRKKLVNPYCMTIFNYEKLRREYYIMDCENDNFLESALAILDGNELIGNDITIMNKYFYNGVKDYFSKDINTIYCNFDNELYIDFLQLIHNIYLYFESEFDSNGYILLEQLISVFQKINDTDLFLFKSGHPFDPYFLEVANKEYYNIYKKFFVNKQDSFDDFKNNFFVYQLVSSLYDDDYDGVESDVISIAS